MKFLFEIKHYSTRSIYISIYIYLPMRYLTIESIMQISYWFICWREKIFIQLSSISFWTYCLHLTCLIFIGRRYMILSVNSRPFCVFLLWDKKREILHLKITIVININHGNWILDKPILIVLDNNYFLYSSYSSFFFLLFASSSLTLWLFPFVVEYRDICKLSLSSHVAHGISMFFFTISNEEKR